MTNSKQIAGLIGPTIIVLTISEMMNFHIIHKIHVKDERNHEGPEK